MSPVYLFQLEHAQIQISQGGRLGGRGEGYLSLLEGGGGQGIFYYVNWEISILMFIWDLVENT